MLEDSGFALPHYIVETLQYFTYFQITQYNHVYALPVRYRSAVPWKQTVVTLNKKFCFENMYFWVKYFKFFTSGGTLFLNQIRSCNCEYQNNSAVTAIAILQPTEFFVLLRRPCCKALILLNSSMLIICELKLAISVQNCSAAENFTG